MFVSLLLAVVSLKKRMVYFCIDVPGNYTQHYIIRQTFLLSSRILYTKNENSFECLFNFEIEFNSIQLLFSSLTFLLSGFSAFLRPIDILSIKLKSQNIPLNWNIQSLQVQYLRCWIGLRSGIRALSMGVKNLQINDKVQESKINQQFYKSNYTSIAIYLFSHFFLTELIILICNKLRLSYNLALWLTMGCKKENNIPVKNLIFS